VRRRRNLVGVTENLAARNMLRKKKVYEGGEEWIGRDS
jgi:hypothetical protein